MTPKSILHKAHKSAKFQRHTNQQNSKVPWDQNRCPQHCRDFVRVKNYIQSIVYFFLAAPVQPPTIESPLDVFFNKNSTFVCNAITASQGQVLWMIKRPGQNDFVSAFENIAQDVTLATNSCGETHRVTVNQVFDASWNETYVRCDVTDPPSSSEPVQILVIPGRLKV